MPADPTPVLPRPRHEIAPNAAMLFEVLDCAHPLRPSARHLLAGLDLVVLCRGEERSAQRDGATLKLFIPDRFMSAEHARLRREGDRFRLEDAGSTNGTLHNGTRCESAGATLDDYDQIEVGRTQLLFRTAVPRDGGAPDVDARDLPGPTPLLSTMVALLQAELERLPSIARSSVPVVIHGESGTGKELIAQALHDLSGRRGPFVAVNCGAIVPQLAEANLFGHRRGAFADATETRPGLVRTADKGTLFLDEIADLPESAQAALLRVLQEKEVLGVGEMRPVPVDLRVVAATHVDLEAAIGVKEFRHDLFARLAGFTVRLPPLRWRREDLGLLIAALLRKIAPDRAERISFTAEAGRALVRYRWPLNIRELEHCLASAVVLARDGVIDAAHLSPPVQRAGRGEEPGSPLPGLEPAAKAERPPLSPEDARLYEELIALLREHQGNVAAVARVKDVARMQVHRWVRRFALNLADFRRRR
jgi:DNA-binding NtrC family response regulator